MILPLIRCSGSANTGNVSVVNTLIKESFDMKLNAILFVLIMTMAVGASGGWAGAGDNCGKPVREAFCRCSEPEIRMPPPPSPDSVMDHMAKQLRLTCEQQKKIRELFEQDWKKVIPLMQQQEEYRKQLQTAMSSAKFDEAAIRTIAVKQAQSDVELSVSRARLWNQVNNLLTPDQRALAEKLPPPFNHGHGPKPFFNDEKMGPDHMPPPPYWETGPCCPESARNVD